jgi:hypothetical protein
MNGPRVLGLPDVHKQARISDLIDSILAVEEHPALVDYSSHFLLYEDVLALVDVLFFDSCIFLNVHMHPLLLLVI